jgi:hypothetical protein
MCVFLINSQVILTSIEERLLRGFQTTFFYNAGSQNTFFKKIVSLKTKRYIGIVYNMNWSEGDG